MAKQNKEEIIKLKEKLTNYPDFKGVEILDSWFEDIDELEDEVRVKRNYLNKVKRERRKQPTLNVETIINKEKRTMKAGYQILITKDGNPFYCEDF
jgi:hypothetical protein